ncbi:uncharacterized protein FFNC_05481 [Fusarium fujikuroi]|nr:uncharacterized protein FFNC_05481 [Fusarium fujikuroi]
MEWFESQCLETNGKHLDFYIASTPTIMSHLARICVCDNAPSTASVRDAFLYDTPTLI